MPPSDHPSSNELLGDLLVAHGNIEAALQAYAELEASPMVEYKMRGALARGRALLSKKKYSEAMAEFEKALAVPFDTETQKGTPLETLRSAAGEGKTECLAGMGREGSTK